ncbi:MAG: LptE family protein [Flavobacteriales bacterium]
MLRNTLILLLLLSLSGCGIYSFYGTDDSGAKTFSVDMFDVKAPQANPLIGQSFTETLRDLIQQQSSVQLVEDKAELKFEGSIINYGTQPISVQGDETASQSRLTIGVNVKYENTIEKDKSFERSFSWYADYSSEADFLSIEQDLIEEISEQLTQNIYNASLGNW